MEREHKKLIKAHNSYVAANQEMELAIMKLVEFEFFIVYHYSDGHCLGNLNTANVAPLSTCISIIKDKGTLSESDHKSICI